MVARDRRQLYPDATVLVPARGGERERGEGSERSNGCIEGFEICTVRGENRAPPNRHALLLLHRKEILRESSILLHPTNTSRGRHGDPSLLLHCATLMCRSANTAAHRHWGHGARHNIGVDQRSYIPIITRGTQKRVVRRPPPPVRPPQQPQPWVDIGEIL